MLKPGHSHVLSKTLPKPTKSKKMRDNFNLSLISEQIQLVPYRKKFVARYHEWMQDESILELTASEPLSLEEEYAMQESWKNDKNKCTFIVLKAESEVNELDRMAGDVNLFLSRSHEDDSLIAEIDIMIAEEKYRKMGFGKEAVLTMMWYGVNHLRLNRFFAKISKENTPSLRLFEKLGYKMVNFVEVFGEYEYVYDIRDNAELAEKIESFGKSVRTIEYNEEDSL